MASFRKRNDKWQARVTKLGFPPQTKSFIVRSDAERWARGIERSMDMGEFKGKTAPQPQTVGYLLKRYAIEVAETKRGANVEVIRLEAMQRTAFAAIELSNLTAPAVASYRDERLKVVSGPTVLRELQIISAVLNHARREWNLPIVNVVADVRRPSPSRGRSRILETAEETALLDHLEGGGRSEHGTYRQGTRNPWIAPLVRLALETAMRRGELLGLYWGNVDLAKRTAHLPMTKNGNCRTVPLSTMAVAVLSGLPQSIDGRVFPTTANALKLAFVRACDGAGVEDFHFHDLRHTATSRLAERLPNVIELAAVTGHSDVRMLGRYYHCKPEMLALKLG